MLINLYLATLKPTPLSRASIINIGANGYINNNKLRIKSSSPLLLRYHSHNGQPCNGHSHTHGNSNDDENLDIPEKNIHHYYEYIPGQDVKKVVTVRNGEKIFIKDGDSNNSDISNTKPSKHGHAHSHPEFPEMDNMDLSGEDFTINVNPQKKTLWTQIKKFFDPHSPLSELGGTVNSHTHNHSHSSDPEALKLYDPKNLTNEGVKITWIGFGVNCSMAITKFIGGFYFHSQALIADAVHAVGDLISDILTLTTVRFTNKKPDSLYPFGYGKIETIGSLMVSFILLYAGFQIGWSSFYEIIAPIIPNALHDLFALIPVHSHSHVDLTTIVPNDVNETGHEGHDHIHEATKEVANINAAWLALASIGVKEWLFRATRKVGERLNSKVLIANAWHHRVDSLTSVVAVATISTGYFLNIYWLDAIGGLFVSILIMKVGISGVVQSFKELIDKALPTSDLRYTEIEDSINVILMKNDSHILIKELSILPSGTNLNLVLKLGVSSFDKNYENKLTLEQMGSIGEILKKELSTNFHNIKHTSVQFISNADEKSKIENNDDEIKEKSV